MQIKNTHQSGEKGTLLHCWWEYKLVQPLWRTVWRFLKTLKIELPYDPEIPLLGIYPDKTIIQKDKCTPMLVAALFTIAKTWKQLKCPSTDEWRKKMWYMYTMEYYSAIKKNEIMPFAVTWMHLEIITLRVVSQRKTNTTWYHLYVESKIWHKWTYLRNRNRLTDIENRLVVAKRDELGVCQMQTIRYRMDKQGVQYSTGNYIQYPVINHNGKEYEKECIYMDNWITLLYSRNWCNIINQLYFNKINFKKIKLKRHTHQKEPSSQSSRNAQPRHWEPTRTMQEAEFSSPPTSVSLSFRFPVWVFLRYQVCEKGLTSPAVRELGHASSSPGPSIFQTLPCFARAVLQFLTPLLSSIRNDWILKNAAAELFLAPFPPAPESAAHQQPLTAVRRGFQIPGFLLKRFDTSFLWAQPHWRGERNMPEELHKMPFVWGVWFFSLLCRKT